MALKLNVKNGFGKNSEVIPKIPAEQQRMLKLTRPDITKLIDMSRQTSTVVTIKDRNGNVYRENVSYYEPIQDIKERIRKKHNLVGMLSLMYKGNEVEDNKFLSDYMKVLSNDDTMYIASNQGSLSLQLRPDEIPVFNDKEEKPTALSDVDSDGNVRRIFAITPRK